MILFGMGQLGRYMAAQLGSKVTAATDNNPALWHTEVDGIEVFPPDTALWMFPDHEYVVSIYNGTAVRKQLLEMGVRKITHFMDVLGRETVDVSKVNQLLPLLADTHSQEEVLNQISGRVLTEHLPISEIYFPSFMPLKEEVFVDCGAFTGDTVEEFVKRDPNFNYIVAIEPMSANREKIRARTRMQVRPFAVGDHNGHTAFALNGAGSKPDKDGVEDVEVRRLDDMLWGMPPTFIKMDVEGAELEAIRGGAELIRNYSPKLAVCLYHKRSHLWEIPLLLHEINPNYKLYIRRYAEDCWELVCYAIPKVYSSCEDE